MNDTDDIIRELHHAMHDDTEDSTPHHLRALADQLSHQTYQVVGGEKLWDIGRWRLSTDELTGLIRDCLSKADDDPHDRIELHGQEVGDEDVPKDNKVLDQRLFVLRQRGVLDGTPVDYDMPGLVDVDRRILATRHIVNTSAADDLLFFVLLSTPERDVSVSRRGQIVVERPEAIQYPREVSPPLWQDCLGSSPDTFRTELLDDWDAFSELVDHLQKHDRDGADDWTPELLHEKLQTRFDGCQGVRTPMQDVGVFFLRKLDKRISPEELPMVARSYANLLLREHGSAEEIKELIDDRYLKVILDEDYDAIAEILATSWVSLGRITFGGPDDRTEG